MEGYCGPRCEECAPGYRNYPNCEPCDCNRAGSANLDTCEEQCMCKVGEGFDHGRLHSANLDAHKIQ